MRSHTVPSEFNKIFFVVIAEPMNIFKAKSNLIFSDIPNIIEF